MQVELAAAQPSNGDRGRVQTVWTALQSKGLLGPWMCAWYKLILDRWAGVICFGMSAAGLLYLAVFPDVAMSEAYTEKLARTISGSAALYMLIGCARLAGAKRLLGAASMLRHVERHGEGARKWMGWTPVDSSVGLLFDGLFLYRTRKLLWLTAGVVAGLAIARAWAGASAAACAIYASAGFVLQILVLPAAYVTRLTEAISKAMVQSLLQDIVAFRGDLEDRDEHFWEEALERYRDLDRGLTSLWATATYAFLPHVAAHALLGYSALIVTVQSLGRDPLVHTICLFSLLYSAVNTLRDIWVLTSITSLCTARSSFEEGSLFSAAFSKLGRSEMTEREREEHWVFLKSMEMSPTGVKMFTLVDVALLTRIAAPLITADVTIISYMFATLEINFPST